MLWKLLCSSYQLRRGDLERVEEEGQRLRVRERERERERARVNQEGKSTFTQVALPRRLILLVLGDRKFLTPKTF